MLLRVIKIRLFFHGMGRCDRCGIYLSKRVLETGKAREKSIKLLFYGAIDYK